MTQFPMPALRRLGWHPGAALLGLLLGGCVTINIYFPAAAAEKAADLIIDEVWRMKSGPAATPAAPTAPAVPASKEKAR